MRSKTLPACSLLTILLVACGGASDDEEPEEPGQAVESTEMTTNEAGLLAASTANLEASGSGEDVATAAAENVPDNYSPSECVATNQDGATVTYELDDCTGPFGRATATGTLEVTYSVNRVVHADISGDDVQVNQATVDISAEVEYRQPDGDELVHVTTDSAGSTGDGRQMQRTGVYDVIWQEGDSCLTLEGSWDTEVDERPWTTEVIDYTACENQCPEDGGKVVWGGLTVSFDGSDQARWEGLRGRTGTVELECEG